MQKKKLLWHITEIKDVNGNYLEFDYTMSSSGTLYHSHRIDKILYGGNKVASKSHFGQILFNYENRPDIEKKYLDGSLVKQIYRIDNIVVKSYGTEIKKYDLNYRFDEVSKLESVSQSSLGEDLNPIVFEWENHDYSIIKKQNNFSFPKSPNYTSQISKGYNFRMKMHGGDFNGDGVNDFVLEEGFFGGGGYIGDTKAMNWALYINSGNQYTRFKDEGYFDKRYYNNGLFVFDRDGDGKSELYIKKYLKECHTTIIGDEPEDPIDPLLPKPRRIIEEPEPGSGTAITTCVHYSQLQCFEMIDDEFQRNEEKDFKIRLENSDHHDRLTILPGDFDGDGDLDLVTFYSDGKFYRSVGVYAPKTLNNIGSARDFQLLDFNGDGRTDILMVKSDKIEVYSYDKAERKFSNLYSSSEYNSRDVYKVGDFNGDGNSDLLIKKYNSRWIIKQSTGIDLVDGIVVPDFQFSSFSKYRINCVDINGDGKSDIIYFKDASPGYGSSAWSPDYQLNILVSEGDSFSMKFFLDDLRVDGGFEANRLSSIGNYDNFGGKDFVFYHNTKSLSQTLFCFKESGVAFNKITGITNSLGNKLDVAYDYTGIDNIDGVRRHDSEEGYHIDAEKSVGLTIVSSVKGLYKELHYAYGYSIVDKTGRGFLGFDLFAITDILNNKIALSEYEYNDFYKLLLLKKQSSWNSKDNVLKGANLESSEIRVSAANSEVEFNNIIKRHYPSPPKCFQQFVDEIWSVNNLSGTSKIKTIEFDDYLNQKVVKEISYNDSDFSDVALTVEKRMLDYRQKGAWCPNKPETIEVIKTNDTGSQTRITKYDYFDNGNLKSKTQDPEDRLEVKIVFDDYDDFGNPGLKSTTTNSGTRTTIFDYSDSGVFLEREEDQTSGISINYDFDETFGLLMSETDHLGLTTKYEYDGFGRQIKATYPDGTYSVKSLQWAGGKGRDGAVYYSYEETSGQSPVWTWYDGQGRELRKEYYGFKDDKKIWVDTDYYSETGRLKTVSKPYFAEGSKEPAESYTYDDEGRVLTKTTPMGITIMEYDGLTTTITSPRSVKVETVNAAGQTVSSIVDGRSVTFSYYPSGKMKESKPQDGKAVEMVYDLQGNRTKITDPDAGIVENTYNGFGEVLTEKYTMGSGDDERIVTTSYTYDESGRVDEIDRNGKIMDYKYDESNGFLESVKNPGHEVTYVYDEGSDKSLGRPTTLNEKIDGKTFTSRTTYDAFGREQKHTYPSGFYVRNIYTKYSHLEEVKGSNGKSIWKGEVANALGQFKKIKKGGKTTTYGYDEKDRVESIYSPDIIDHFYIFNDKGNLKSREARLTSHKEIFTYEKHQLKTWKIEKNGNVASTFSMEYDEHGNITGKSDLGYEMQYNDERPHAISGIKGNPSLISDQEQIITYTDFKKIATVSEGDKRLELLYGVDEQRRKAIFKSNGDITLTRFYLGDYEEEEKPDGKKRKIHYLSGGNGLAAIYIEEDGNSHFYYAYTDYLGSLTVLTDNDGNVEERQAFDPWGNRRNPSDWTSLITTPVSNITARGYTMHEHLDGFALINMNGRVYDPQIARFLSPDPQLQAPGYWLNYNRYGYCLNNPLLYTDPTGEFFWAALPLIAKIGIGIGAGVGAYTGYKIGEANGASGLGMAGYILGGAAIGGFSGYLGGTIAAGGGFMANTSAIMAGSYTNSMGMAMLSGGDMAPSISFGVASFNFGTGEFGYLGKEGNSFMENLGYGLGALANVSDVLAGFKPGEVQLNTEKSDAIGHSALTKVGETDPSNSFVSVGPDPGGKWIFNPFKFKNGTNHWKNYVDAGDDVLKIGVKGVNAQRIASYGANLDRGVNYNLYFSSCVNHTARALTLAGAPSIGLHPFILHSQMVLRSVGFRPMLYSYHLYQY